MAGLGAFGCGGRNRTCMAGMIHAFALWRSVRHFATPLQPIPLARPASPARAPRRLCAAIGHPLPPTQITMPHLPHYPAHGYIVPYMGTLRPYLGGLGMLVMICKGPPPSPVIAVLSPYTLGSSLQTTHLRASTRSLLR